jgi:hypothetical protein
VACTAHTLKPPEQWTWSRHDRAAAVTRECACCCVD